MDIVQIDVTAQSDFVRIVLKCYEIKRYPENSDETLKRDGANNRARER